MSNITTIDNMNIQLDNLLKEYDGSSEKYNQIENIINSNSYLIQNDSICVDGYNLETKDIDVHAIYLPSSNQERYRYNYPKVYDLSLFRIMCMQKLDSKLLELYLNNVQNINIERGDPQFSPIKNMQETYSDQIVKMKINLTANPRNIIINSIRMNIRNDFIAKMIEHKSTNMEILFASVGEAIAKHDEILAHKILRIMKLLKNYTHMVNNDYHNVVTPILLKRLWETNSYYYRYKLNPPIGWKEEAEHYKLEQYIKTQNLHILRKSPDDMVDCQDILMSSLSMLLLQKDFDMIKTIEHFKTSTCWQFYLRLLSLDNSDVINCRKVKHLLTSVLYYFAHTEYVGYREIADNQNNWLHRRVNHVNFAGGDREWKQADIGSISKEQEEKCLFIQQLISFINDHEMNYNNNVIDMKMKKYSMIIIKDKLCKSKKYIKIEISLSQYLSENYENIPILEYMEYNTDRFIIKKNDNKYILYEKYNSDVHKSIYGGYNTYIKTIKYELVEEQLLKT